MPYCSNCHTPVKSGITNCPSCFSEDIISNEEAIARLEQKCNRIQSYVQQEIGTIRKEIALIKSLSETESPLAEKKVVVSDHKVSSERVNTVKSFEPKVVPTQPTPKKHVKPRVARPPKLKREPSQLEKQIIAYLSPINEATDYLSELYASYKKEGKLPVFLMTVAGIVALVFGLGFLMQQSTQYLGEYEGITRIGFGFLMAGAAVFFGWKLSKRDDKYKEYASALFGLGLIINYLMIYFLSELEGIISVSTITGFLFVTLNTATAIFLSLRYETKIIALLSLFGGALVPFTLAEFIDTDYYFLYLWLLSGASVYVAYKIQWFTLNKVNLALVLGIVEMSVFGLQSRTWLSLVYYHLFAYLFYYTVFFNKTLIKEKLSRIELIYVVANTVFLIANLFEYFESNQLYLGIVYAANAMLFGAFILFKWKVFSRETKFLFFVVLGTFSALSIQVLTTPSITGLFWLIEAFLLLLVGLRFEYARIRQEAYVLFLPAICKLVIGLESLSSSVLFSTGYFNLLVIGVMFGMLSFLLAKYRDHLLVFELKILSACNELIPVWFSILFFYTAHHFVATWSYILTSIPMILYFLWFKRFKTKWTSYLGLAHILFFMVPILVSMNEVDSLKFRDQNSYGKVGAILLFLSLWSAQWIFDRFNIKGFVYKISCGLRVLFFCLVPLLVILQAKRHLPEFVPASVWIAMLITYGLYKWQKYKALRYEVFVLFAGTVLSNIFVGDLLIYEGVAALIVLNVINLIEKPILEEDFRISEFKVVSVLSPFISLGVISYILMLGDMDNFPFGITIYGLLLAALTLMSERVYLFKVIKKQLLAFGLFFTMVGNMTTFPEPNIFINFLAILSLGIPLLGFVKSFKEEKEVHLKMNGLTLLFQLMVINVYCGVLYSLGLELDSTIFSIVFVLHAITVLFLATNYKVKTLNYVAIGVFAIALLKVMAMDMKGTSIIEKVIVLIVIGVLLLGASFIFLKKKGEKEITETEDKLE